jgi:hypothetical protein
MSKEEIKYEINKVLDKLSDKSLEDLLSFLKSIETKNSSLFSQDSLQKILSEDKELLQKLAQ